MNARFSITKPLIGALLLVMLLSGCFNGNKNTKNTSASSEHSHSISEMNNLIKQNISLADKNWFGTGGAARFFCEPSSVAEFQHALAFANMHNLKLFILGQGANALISDEGFNGLVIKPALTQISMNEIDSNHTLVTAGAGVLFTNLIEFCLDNKLLGLEEFSGIPGTVGGSVYINLHYFDFLLDQFLVSSEIINKKNGTIETVDAQWFNFGYNESALHKKEDFLVSATFKLKHGTDHDILLARNKRNEMISLRAQKLPQVPSYGYFFRKLFEHEVNTPITDKNMLFATYYLDKVGVKGSLRIGDASVSDKHANMIVNMGNATSADIINVAREMQQRVYDSFGIILHPECQLIGFKKYPLLT